MNTLRPRPGEEADAHNPEEEVDEEKIFAGGEDEILEVDDDAATPARAGRASGTGTKRTADASEGSVAEPSGSKSSRKPPKTTKSDTSKKRKSANVVQQSDSNIGTSGKKRTKSSKSKAPLATAPVSSPRASRQRSPSPLPHSAATASRQRAPTDPDSPMETDDGKLDLFGKNLPPRNASDADIRMDRSPVSPMRPGQKRKSARGRGERPTTDSDVDEESDISPRSRPAIVGGELSVEGLTLTSGGPMTPPPLAFRSLRKLCIRLRVSSLTTLLEDASGGQPSVPEQNDEGEVVNALAAGLSRIPLTQPAPSAAPMASADDFAADHWIESDDEEQQAVQSLAEPRRTAREGSAFGAGSSTSRSQRDSPHESDDAFASQPPPVRHASQPPPLRHAFRLDVIRGVATTTSRPPRRESADPAAAPRFGVKRRHK